MRMKRIKQLSDIKLEGIIATIDSVSGNLHRVRLEDAKGNYVVFERETTYNTMNAYTPDAPKMVKKYGVKFSVLGNERTTPFDTEYEAKEHQRKIQEQILDSNPTIEELEVESEEI